MKRGNAPTARFKAGRLIFAAAALILLVGILGNTPTKATSTLETITQNGAKIGNIRWDPSILPVIWQFNDPTTGVPPCMYSSATAPAATLQPAAQAAFNTWQVNPDSIIAFTFGGNTPVRNALSDGVNVVTFCSSTAFGPGTIAQTPSDSLAAPETVVEGGGCPVGQGLLSAGFCFPAGTYPAGTMIDSDVDINTSGTAEQNLTTTGTAGLIDVEDVLTHELGHFIGLSHDPIFGTTMFPVVDDVPFSDGLGQGVLKASDISTVGRMYPGPNFSTNFGTITGTITLDGTPAHGVHVFAVDPNTMLGVAGRFSLSVFEDANALGPDGPDFAASGTGFYRIDGLPPGDYYVMVEYFDDSDFISGRLQNRYNFTVGNSNVSNGNPGPGGQVGPWLGFIPRLAEFFDSAVAGVDSGNGGDGVSAGTAVDNSDAATLVTVAAGQVVPNVDIDINIEPTNGEVPSARENPTSRVTLKNDGMLATDRITAFLLDGGVDDAWAARFPAALLPTPPYNVAEGLWVRGGLTSKPYVSRLAFADPNAPAVPDLANTIIDSAGRVLTGGPNGAVAAGDFIDIRDQWNFTVNQARDLFIVLGQPESAPGISFITQGFFELLACVPDATNACVSNRVGRTLLTQDGGATWFTITNGDLFYDLILETAPPVMVTGATPSSMTEGQTGDVDITGAGFVNGATVDLGPGVTVNSVTFIGSTKLRANVTIANTGATVPRGVNVTVTNPEVVFPNAARVFTIDPLLDADFDGVPDAMDCAPLDPTLKRVPTEVAGITITDLAGSTDVSWTSQDPTAGTGTVYDVVTGLATSLTPDGGYTSAVCAANDHPDSPFIDPTPLALGEIRYWNVRASNGCGLGTFGLSSSTIVPDPRALLDSGAICLN